MGGAAHGGAGGGCAAGAVRRSRRPRGRGAVRLGRPRGGGDARPPGARAAGDGVRARSLAGELRPRLPEPAKRTERAMSLPSAWVLASGLVMVAYTYLGYPLLLILLGGVRGRRRTPDLPARWPALSILLPVHNEETVIRETLENLLQVDYPGPRPQIVVVSDASSHNVSVARIDARANYAEAWYVGYDMWVRDLETRVSGIVGAAGCLYAARAAIHRVPLPDGLSPDFAAALIARERGFRTVSVRNAVCFVPRIPSLSREYRRKVRTIARGWHTLHFKRGLLNPFRYGAFAWILASHKVSRWLMPHVAMVVLATLAWRAQGEPGALVGVGIAGVAMLCGGLGWVWPEGRRLPRVLAVPAYVVIGNLAALHASLRSEEHTSELQ